MPPSPAAAAAGTAGAAAKKKSKKKKKSLVGNFLTDMVESIIKSEIEKHMSR